MTEIIIFRILRKLFTRFIESVTAATGCKFYMRICNENVRFRSEIIILVNYWPAMRENSWERIFEASYTVILESKNEHSCELFYRIFFFEKS